jgi:hypothetical protein
MTFGELLVRKIRHRGYTKTWVCQQLGITRWALYLWISGAVIPTVPNLARLEQILSCPGELYRALADGLLAPAHKEGV